MGPAYIRLPVDSCGSRNQLSIPPPLPLRKDRGRGREDNPASLGTLIAFPPLPPVLMVMFVMLEGCQGSFDRRDAQTHTAGNTVLS